MCRKQFIQIQLFWTDFMLDKTFYAVEFGSIVKRKKEGRGEEIFLHFFPLLMQWQNSELDCNLIFKSFVTDFYVLCSSNDFAAAKTTNHCVFYRAQNRKIGFDCWQQKYCSQPISSRSSCFEKIKNL